jgi:hypothetical protein
VQFLDDDELSTTPEYKAWVSTWLRSSPDFYIIWRFLDKFGEYVGIDPPPFSFKEVELLFSDPTYYAPVATVHIALLKCLKISGKATSVTSDNWRKMLQRLLSDDRSGAFNDVRKMVKVKAAQETAAQAALAASSSSSVHDEGAASSSKSGSRRQVSESSKAAAAQSAEEDDEDEVQQDEDEEEEEETELFFDYCSQPLCVRVLLLSTLCQEVLCCQEPSNKRLADFLRIEFEGDANASKKGRPKKAAAAEAIELDDDGGEAAPPPAAQEKEAPPALGLDGIRALSEPLGAKPLFEDLILSTPAARAPPAPAYVSSLHDEVLALATERVAAVQPQTASGLRAAIAPRALRSVYYLPTSVASSTLLDSGASSSAAIDTVVVAIPFALPKVLSKAKARVEAKERADAKAAKAAAAAAAKAGLDVALQSEVTAPVAIHPADPSLPMALDPRSFFFYVWVDRDDVPRLVRSRSSMPFESIPKQPEFRQFLVKNARASLENHVAAALLETRAKEAEDNEKAAAIAAKVARLEALAVSAGGQYQGSASGTLKRTRDAWAPIAGVAPVPQAAKKKALQPVVGQRSIMGFFSSVKPEVSAAAAAPAASPASEVGLASDSVPAAAVDLSIKGVTASNPMPLPETSADAKAVADADATGVPAVSVIPQPSASTADASDEADVIVLTARGDDLEDVTPMPHMTTALQSPGRSRPQREAAKKAFSPPPPPPPPPSKPAAVVPEPDPENLWISVPRGATGESFATLAVGLEELETFTLSLRFSTSPFDASLADSLEMNVLPDLRERALRCRPKRALATATEGGGRAQAVALRDAREAPPAVPAVRSSRIASKGKASKYVEPDEDDFFDDEE